MINYKIISRPNKSYYYLVVYSNNSNKNNSNGHWIKYEGHVQHLNSKKKSTLYTLLLFDLQ